LPPELNGDDPLGLVERIAYLLRNLRRNCRRGPAQVRRRWFQAARLPRTPRLASPGRALTESFLYSQLPSMLPLGRIRVLELGCGSGSLTRILAEIGYRGEYVGIDIKDRFDRTVQPEFERAFVCADVYAFQPEATFDLVISVSVLEHVSEDYRLAGRLDEFVSPGGIQLHFVPSGWGLFVYLWHGYRQYTRGSLAERFRSRQAEAVSLGGGASFLLHLMFITVGEMLLLLDLRRRLSGLYGRLLDRSLRWDRWVPVCGTMYAVYQPAARADDGGRSEC
jgi:SAM-dependent methyltransferase